jgi:hypothetical protein
VVEGLVEGVLREVSLVAVLHGGRLQVQLQQGVRVPRGQTGPHQARVRDHRGGQRAEVEHLPVHLPQPGVLAQVTMTTTIMTTTMIMALRRRGVQGGGGAPASGVGVARPAAPSQHQRLPPPPPAAQTHQSLLRAGVQQRAQQVAALR